MTLLKTASSAAIGRIFCLLAALFGQAAQADELPPLDEKKLAAEYALFEKLLHVDFKTDPADLYSTRRAVLIEGAAEYCRANKLWEMKKALPEFCRAQLIIYGGPLAPLKNRPNEENFCVVYRAGRWREPISP